MLGDKDSTGSTPSENIMQIKEKAYPGRCSNCGYCPHCGRSNEWANRKPYIGPDCTPYWWMSNGSSDIPTLLDQAFQSEPKGVTPAGAKSNAGTMPIGLGKYPISFVTGLSPANSN